MADNRHTPFHTKHSFAKNKNLFVGVRVGEFTSSVPFHRPCAMWKNWCLLFGKSYIPYFYFFLFISIHCWLKRIHEPFMYWRDVKRRQRTAIFFRGLQYSLLKWVLFLYVHNKNSSIWKESERKSAIHSFIEKKCLN